jgi:hypothetical protein
MNTPQIPAKLANRISAASHKDALKGMQVFNPRLKAMLSKRAPAAAAPKLITAEDFAGAPKLMSREEFSKLSVANKAAFIREGGRLA